MTDKTIDVNKIKSIKSLEDIQATLREFLNNSEVPSVYKEEYGSEEDYALMKKTVIELLKNIKIRLKNLNPQSNNPPPVV